MTITTNLALLGDSLPHPFQTSRRCMLRANCSAFQIFWCKKECLLGRLFTFTLSCQGKPPSPANSPARTGSSQPSAGCRRAPSSLIVSVAPKRPLPLRWQPADHWPQCPEGLEDRKQADTCGAPGGWQVPPCLASCCLLGSVKLWPLR